jgi:hypothetical protein
MNRTVATLTIALLVLSACSSEEPHRSARPSTEKPKAEKSVERPHKKKIKKRKPTGPEKARVVNDALGAAGRLTRQAIDDLKEMGYWDDLTKKIYAVRISSRGDPLDVREDGRLGDSLWTYYKDERTGELGDLCDVLLFTQAVKDDVARQAAYYAQGRLDHPAPTLEQFWTVLLGHEIAHCSNGGQKGEAHSTRWESRILAGYGIDRVGSP